MTDAKAEPTGKALAHLEEAAELLQMVEYSRVEPPELRERCWKWLRQLRDQALSAPTAESGKAWEPKPGNRCRARVAGRWYEATLREPSAGAPMWLVIIDERGDEIPFGAYWVPTVDLSEPATDASAPTAETDRCDRCAGPYLAGSKCPAGNYSLLCNPPERLLRDEPTAEMCGHLIRDGQTTIGACDRARGHGGEAMADVRTLDEWRSTDRLRDWRMETVRQVLENCDAHCCALTVSGPLICASYGPTPDAARAAAAAWVREQGK